MARTLAEIDTEIAATTAALADIRGEETEVYRYGGGRYWHLPGACLCGEKQHRMPACAASPTATQNAVPAGIASYELFARSSCPPSSVIRQYLDRTRLAGTDVNVDTAGGLDLAALRGVLSTPTIIFYDAERREVIRAHNMAEIEEAFALSDEAAIA